jgi:hypothetical protein
LLCAPVRGVDGGGVKKPEERAALAIEQRAHGSLPRWLG